MSWKPRSESNKQWRRPQNYNQQNGGDHYNQRYNNNQWGRHQQYNQDNVQYNDSNYNQNQYHQNNYYHNNNNKYNKNNNNYHHHSNYNQNNRNNRDYHQYNNNHNEYNKYNQYKNQYNNNEYHNNNNNNHRYYNKKYQPQLKQQNKDIKYVKNTGKFEIEDIAFNELTSTLESIWNKYYNLSSNIECVSKIILLCGPPGSGKSTICKFIEKYYNLNELNNNEYILDVSTICSDVMKENKRKLIVAKIYEKLFKQILENKNKNKILIIDGFLRKEQHVYVARFLRLHLKKINFIFLVINVDQNTSILRQLERGKKLTKLSNDGGRGDEQKQNDNDINKKRIFLKDSDLFEHAARKRYQKYDYLLKTVRDKLKNEMKIEFDIIDAAKSLENVYQSVQKQLEKQDTKSNNE